MPAPTLAVERLSKRGDLGLVEATDAPLVDQCCCQARLCDPFWNPSYVILGCVPTTGDSMASELSFPQRQSWVCTKMGRSSLRLPGPITNTNRADCLR